MTIDSSISGFDGVFDCVDKLFVEGGGFFLWECCQFAVEVNGRVGVCRWLVSF